MRVYLRVLFDLCMIYLMFWGFNSLFGVGLPSTGDVGLGMAVLTLIYVYRRLG